VWQLGGALEGPTFCFLDAELAQKGPTSPSEGLDVSFLAHIMTFLAFNVKNSVILLVSLVGCFNDLFLKLKVIWMI
jgi:hypothetical protein